MYIGMYSYSSPPTHLYSAPPPLTIILNYHPSALIGKYATYCTKVEQAAVQDCSPYHKKKPISKQENGETVS